MVGDSIVTLLSFPLDQGQGHEDGGQRIHGLFQFSNQLVHFRWFTYMSYYFGLLVSFEHFYFLGARCYLVAILIASPQLPWVTREYQLALINRRRIRFQ